MCSSYSSNHCLSPSLKVGLPTEECSQNVKTCSTEITSKLCIYLYINDIITFKKYQILAIDSDICPIHNAKCFNHSRFREEVVIRGCSANDFEYPENNSGEEQQIYVATNCSTSLCNNENFVQDNCIQCRGSKLNGNCYSDFSKEMMITCPNIVKTPKGCFTAFNATTGEVRRDCASILNEEVITYKICFGDFCNSQILNISDENVNKIEENVELSENDSNKSDKNSNEFTANVNNSEKNVNKSVECVDKIQDNLNESEESLNISTGEDSNRPESVQNSFPNSEETSIDKNNTQWCLQCRSEIDGECSLLESSEKFEKKCEKTNIPGEKSGCFTSKMGKFI